MATEAPKPAANTAQAPKASAPAGAAPRRTRPAGAKAPSKAEPRQASREPLSLDAHEADLKKKLARRMAFAAVMIAVLLGALALFDQLSGPSPVRSVNKATEPMPQKEITQPVKPADPAPEVVKEASKPAVTEESAAPTDKGAPPPPTPAAEPSPAPTAKPAPAGAAAIAATKPQAVNKPTLPIPAPTQGVSRPSTQPLNPQLPVPRGLSGQGRTASSSGTSSHSNSGSGEISPPSGPSANSASRNGPQAPTAPLAPSAPTQPVPAQRVSEPAAEVPEAAVLRPPPAAPRLFSGFMLQAGVFASTQRAEELYAKLQLNGIPASIESRVTVGPFKTRQEADAARLKMQSLGMAPVLLAPKGGRK